MASFREQAVNFLEQRTDAPVRTYQTLRRLIGWLGVALPLAVSLGAWFYAWTALQPSISAYYYTSTRNLFVGTLCAIGVFMLCYRGPKRVDEVLSALAGACAICVALFPTAYDDPARWSRPWVVGKLHYSFATLFFAAITWMVLFLFTRTGPAGPAGMTARKVARNRVYVFCGWTMLACVLVLPVQLFLPRAAQDVWDAWCVTFALETLAVEMFGIAWLVKGERFLADPTGSAPPHP